MTIVIAGERSGVGKTTVTLALLASLKRRNLNVQSFKVGPDYIDPMFHHYVTGLPCRNLDPVLTSECYVQECFAFHTQGVEYALVEGVMGLFDGVSAHKISQLSFASGKNITNDKGQMTNDQIEIINFASTAHIARLLNLPVLLVIDCSRLSGSVAAIALGYRSFDPNLNLAGVVLNRVGSDRHLELLKDALAPFNLPIFGVLRRQDHITIPDRHLGLVPTAELPQLDILIDKLADLGDTCFDWDRLLPLVECGRVGSREQGCRGAGVQGRRGAGAQGRRGAGVQGCRGENFVLHPSKIQKSSVPIAIARDRAFNFYYQDNLDLLEKLGAELVFWSPIADSNLPKGVGGLYFGGGFPEVFAAELSSNLAARKAVQTAILSGIPTYAECGGLMYLCENIIDFKGKSWPMVGVLPTTAKMGSQLTLGYRQATAMLDSPLLPAGAKVSGHEFHRSSLSEIPINPLFEIKGYNASSLSTNEGWKLHQVHASYLHLHFGINSEIPAQFCQNCAYFLNS